MKELQFNTHSEEDFYSMPPTCHLHVPLDDIEIEGGTAPFRLGSIGI